MKVYYNSANGESAPVVIDGEPPVDQTAEVAALKAQVVTLTDERNARQAAIDAMKVAAQKVIDAAGGF